MLKWILKTHNNSNQNTSPLIHTPIFGPQNSLFLKKLEIEEFYIVNSIQKKIERKKSGMNF